MRRSKKKGPARTKTRTFKMMSDEFFFENYDIQKLEDGIIRAKLSVRKNRSPGNQ